MDNKKRYLLLGFILVVVAIFTVYLSRNKDTVIWQPDPEQPVKEQQPVNEQQPVQPTEEVQQVYENWETFRNGYSLPLPPGWKNTSDTGGRAVLVPGSSPESQIGSITELSVTVLSDAKAPQGQQFTTQREFDDWQKVEGEVQGQTQKLDNLMMDGTPGIELLDLRGGENEWSVIVWARKEEKNIYITFKGNKKYSTEDASAIDYVVSNFKFNSR